MVYSDNMILVIISIKEGCHMKLYSSIKIEDILEGREEVNNYYLIEGKRCGLKITKSVKGAGEQSLTIKNIMCPKENMRELITLLIKSGSDFTQIPYIIQDYEQSHTDLLV